MINKILLLVSLCFYHVPSNAQMQRTISEYLVTDMEGEIEENIAVKIYHFGYDEISQINYFGNLRVRQVGECEGTKRCFFGPDFDIKIPRMKRGELVSKWFDGNQRYVVSGFLIRYNAEHQEIDLKSDSQVFFVDVFQGKSSKKIISFLYSYERGIISAVSFDEEEKISSVYSLITFQGVLSKVARLEKNAE